MQTGAGDIDAWLIDLETQQDIEGPGVGENYAVYGVRVRYYSKRVDTTNWLEVARGKVESVIDKLSKNQSVFAIGGQPQLKQPETVELRTFGKQFVAGNIYGEQTYVKAELYLGVEARRWT